MNGFRGNHRSAGPGKKERKATAYHHELACRCSAPFLKLHYNDCPVLTEPCPEHGNFFHRRLKQDKAGRKQNVQASNNPASKTERLFRPVKSLLTVCDPEMKFHFRYHSPKNSSSHETIKRQTDSENVKTNSNKRFVEKAKPFVAGQTNKIKKLKQCFHSPCSSILNRSRSQAFVNEKPIQRRDFYSGVPEVPPDEKKYDSGFKWFPTGKLNFKTSEKSGFVTACRRESDDVNNKALGGVYKPKKGVKDTDSIPIFNPSVPVFGFSKEATQLVYSSFTIDDSKKKTRDGKGNEGKKGNPKEGKDPAPTAQDSSASEVQTSSSSDDTESVYFVPFLVQPVGKRTTEEELPKEKPARSVMTQTSETVQPTKEPQTIHEIRKDLKDSSVQTDHPAEEASPRKRGKERDASTQTEDKQKEVVVVDPSASRPQSEGDDQHAFEPEGSNVSFELELLEPRISDQTLYYDIKPGARQSPSDEELDRIAGTTPDHERKNSDEAPKPPMHGKELTHDRGNQTLPPEEVGCVSHSQQTSIQEEALVPLHELAEIKDIILEYFRRTQPDFDKRHVDHETMTDNVAPQTAQPRTPRHDPNTSRRKSSPGGRPAGRSEAKQQNKPESKPESSPQNKSMSPTKSPARPASRTGSRPQSRSQNRSGTSPQSLGESRQETQGGCRQLCHSDSSNEAEYRCIHIDDLERAAVFCLCSVCGREVKRFSINITRNNDDTPYCEIHEMSNAVDVYSEMIEMKTTRTKVSSPEAGQLNEAMICSSPPKGGKKPMILACESWNSSPTTSANKGKSCNKSYQKPDATFQDSNDSTKTNGQLPRDPQKYSGNSHKDRFSKEVKENGESKNRSRSKPSEFYYPVIIKPLLSRHFTKMLEKKFDENASEESDVPISKQKKRAYFDPTDVPASKTIKHGYEEHPRECFTRERPDFSDSPNAKHEEKMKKGVGSVVASPNEHFCAKHFPKTKDKKSKNLSRMKSLSLGSLNNLLSSKSCHLKPIPIGCDEPSLRDLLEFSARKSVRFLKTDDGGVLYHPWPSGILAYEADEGSASSLDEKKAQTTPSRENSPNEEECCRECTCCLSDSSDSPYVSPMKEIVEEPDEYDWDSHSRRPELKPQRRKSRSFSGYPQGNSDSGGTFWFGRDQKRK